MKKILLTLLTASLLITGCTSVTKSGAVGADRGQFMAIPSEVMEQSSAQAYVKTLTAARNKGELNVDPILTKRVQDIAKRLIVQTTVFREDALKWKWQVNVINEDTLNAWCMPGGRIVVYSGIIKRLNLTDAQLAAIMGHEIAHALREHSREQASADQAKNIGIVLLAAITGLGDFAVNALNKASEYAIMKPFSRSHETEADHIGTELMARAGYDPKEAVEVWVKMSKMSGGKVPEILSTHPSNESRIKDLKEIAAKLEPVYQAAKKG